jgi:hypothetical protein
VYALIDSPDWILNDGFMTQSRVGLLELLQWAFLRSTLKAFAASAGRTLPVDYFRDGNDSADRGGYPSPLLNVREVTSIK